MKLIHVLALSFLVLAAGCPKEKKALNIARKSVEISAQTVLLVDVEVSRLYSEASASALSACDTPACYQNKMHRWDKTILAVNSMKLSLLTLENALDAWEAGSPNGRDNLFGAAACFLQSLTNLSDLLGLLGVNVPALDHGLSVGAGMLGSTGIACPGGTP